MAGRPGSRGDFSVCVRDENAAANLLVGWLWYLGTLVPVNGVIEQIGSPPAWRTVTLYIPMIR